MNNNERLEGKVVKLLNAREVVINLGRNSGVKCGMYFDVMDKDLEDIIDPDTGEKLGSIDRVKKTLKVTEVGEKISILSTLQLHNRRTLSDILLATSPIPSLSGLNYDTLKKEKNMEEIALSESIVKISDKVVLNKDFKESTK